LWDGPVPISGRTDWFETGCLTEAVEGMVG
jgi:hypothetical protein